MLKIPELIINSNLNSVHTVEICMQKKVRQTQLSITFPPHVYVTAACGSVLWKLRMDSKGNRLPGLSQPTPKQKWEKCGRAGVTETPKELSKNREREKKPIKTYVLGPWRPMSCLKSPRLNLQRPQVRLRGYQPLFGVNYHCLSRYVPLHLNGLTCLMQSGGWKQRANVYQRPRSGFFECTSAGRDSGIPITYSSGCVCVEMGCERKPVGGRGVEPCHPVVTSHTCPLFRRDRIALTFVQTLCAFQRWMFVLHFKANTRKDFVQILFMSTHSSSGSTCCQRHRIR